MTVEHRALLEAIRIIVGEAVAPLTTQVGGLSERFDGLSTRVDGLIERFDGLSARVDVLTDRVDGLSTRVDGLTERVDDLTERVDDLTERFDGQTVRIDALFEHVGGLTMQMDTLIGRTDRIETIEMRTAQTSSDVRDLLEQQEKLTKSLRTLRREVEYAITQIEVLQDNQPGYQQQLRLLLERVDSLERRMAKLESSEDTP